MVDQWKAPVEAEPAAGDDKSWKLLEKTLLAGIQEQRRARRWGFSSSCSHSCCWWLCC